MRKTILRATQNRLVARWIVIYPGIGNLIAIHAIDFFGGRLQDALNSRRKT